MANIGLNALLGGYYGTALIARQYAGACQPSSPSESAVARKAEEAEGKWPPPEESVSEPKSVSQSVEERFESRLENRFRKRDNAEVSQAAAKAERFKNAALEVGEALGQAKANEFMNKVLVSINSEVDPSDPEESADLAVNSFFETLSDLSFEDPEAYQKLEDVKRSLTDAVNTQAAEEGIESEKGPALTEAQGRLYQSYVQGRAIAASNYSITRQVGNLVNAFM